MARYTLTLTVDAAQPASVEKKLREAFGKDVPVHTVEKVKTAESRADRLSEAMSSVDDAKSVVEELKDELQNWRDNLPENMQSGTKADELDEAISTLEQVFDNLESATGDAESVSFPGMMG